MPTVTDAIGANRAAVDDMILAAEASASAWTTPRAPGKWCPAQVVEHVARVLEEAANEIAGRPSKLPAAPFFLRPLARMFFRRMVRTGKIMKAKANKPMDPIVGSATPDEACVRLEDALAAFEEAARTCGEAGRRVGSGMFGSVSLADYATFIALHTRHHIKQIPVIL